MPALQASGKDWATPWSVMAMAGWPQAMARFTASLVSVRASIRDILVCRWSSTRFSGALSFFTGFSAVSMIRGSRTMSLSNRFRFSRPEIFRCIPVLTPSTMGSPSSPGMNLLTRMELV